ncbi:MAG: hypothetical protein IKC65_00170 [Lentisphaeria bacterium]|nr:hypothetical protein [Lentisphaeria bacterium]
MSEPTTPVILKKKEGCHTGEPLVREYTVKVSRRQEEKSKDKGSIVYIFPAAFPCPEPGDSVVDDGIEHTVAAIGFCRDISGVLRGIKCTVLN